MSSSRYPSIAGIDGTGSAGEIAIWDDSAVLGGESTLTYSSNQLAITSLTNDKELLKLITNSTNTYARITVINSDATRYFQLATTFDATQVPAMAEHLTIGSDSTTIMSFGRAGQVFLNQSGASASSPTLVHRNFADTGLYWPGADVLSVAADGVNVASFASSGVAIKGTNTNNNATAAWVGEQIQSVVSLTSVPMATTQYGTLASISLTAGDWDVSAVVKVTPNGATITLCDFGIGTADGNSTSGMVPGDNAYFPALNGSNAFGASIPPWRVSIAGTTTYYLKLYLAYSVATPQYECRISARRVR